MIVQALALTLLTTATGTAAYGEATIAHEWTTSAEYTTEDDSISVYNTGLTLNLDNGHGLSADFRGALDEKIDEIDSRDFELGTFVKELNVNYQIDTQDAVLILSVGKMPSGVKVDPDDPRAVGGVMGMRLSINPKKVPLVQEWLNKNGWRINRIDIVRYKSGTEDSMDFREVTDSNMTSYALFLSKGHNLQTFFIYKTPDRENIHGVTSKSLGAVYMPGGKLRPQFFVMKHSSESRHMDLDLMVLSTSIAVAPKLRSTLSYSKAIESVGKTEKETYDISMTKNLKKNVSATAGIKFEKGNEGKKNIFYVGVEAKF